MCHDFLYICVTCSINDIYVRCKYYKENEQILNFKTHIMRKRIITLSLAMFALVAAQNVNAAEMAQQPKTDIEHIDKVTKDRPGDKQFKFEVDEMSFDITGAEELVLPKLLNPHKLEVKDLGVSESNAFLVFEVDSITKEVTKLETNRAFMGDVILYANAEKSSKYGPSTAQCVIHFYDPSMIGEFDFTAKTPEDAANNYGDPNGWGAEATDHSCWYCVSSGLWAYGAWANATSYVEQYMMSPATKLEDANSMYQIELINSINGFGDHQDWAGVAVKEEGTDEWIELDPIAFPDKEHQWSQISSGKLNVPVELSGKTIRFGLRYGTDGSTIGNWTISKIRYYKTDATGISNVEVKNEINDNKIYDLQGRMVKNPAHGIYIMNGKKFVIK